MINKIIEKIKNTNFKKIARAFAVIWMIVFIIVMTITNVGIDHSFNWLKWLGAAMILFGIAVFGLFTGESMAIDFSKEKPNGVYQKKLRAYEVVRQLISGIAIYFPVWLEWFTPQRLENKQIDFLITNEVNPKKARNIVLYCDYEDLFELKSGAIKKVVDGKEIFIKKLAPQEIEPVTEVLCGHVNLELSGCAYYLQAEAESNQKDILEQGETYRKARKSNKKTNRTIRLVGGVVVSLGLSILTVGDFMNAGDGQAWVNLVTRMANLFTALFSGWIGGVSDVMIQAKALGNKTDILTLFKSSYEKQLFPLYDEDESAKMEYEKEQARKKESIDSVVDPPEENTGLIPLDNAV